MAWIANCGVARNHRRKPPMKKTNGTAKPDALPPFEFVGRYFHVFGDDGSVNWQGRVVGQIDPTHYLVQFYDWMVGEPGPLHIVTIDQMTSKGCGERCSGAYQFYENRD